MKKIMPFVVGVGFAIFVAAVAVIVVSLSFKALGKIFVDDLFDQMIGLILFDAAALLWFGVFIYKCEATMQYVFSLLGFVLGLGGTFGLVAIEVGISSGTVAQAEMMQPLTYTFIGVAIGHLTLIYLWHGSAPEVSSNISMGVDLAKVVSEGQKQAEEHIKREMPNLGAVISSRLIAEAMQQLNIRPQIIDAKALPVYDDLNTSTNNYPVNAEKVRPTKSILDFARGVQDLFRKPDDKHEYEQVVRTPVQNEGDKWGSGSPIAETLTPAPRPDYEQVGALHHEVKREKLPEIFRGEPIIFDSMIETSGVGVQVKIGDALQAILCEDGKYNLSTINAAYAFARISPDELKLFRTGKYEEATQTGADFREE